MTKNNGKVTECMFKKPKKSDMISGVKQKNGETNLITIYCALYMEAQYLIQHYELKKASVSRHFQVFASEEKGVRLVITGVGRTNAAVAVAEISMIYPPAPEDIMLNYGSCAGENRDMVTDGKHGSGAFAALGSMIMVNKLTDVESGRTFYPDMIYRHPFFEGEVETSVHVYPVEDDRVLQKEQTPEQLIVHDMEAAAFYEAGNFFYGPHQMMFLKVVTDHGMSVNKTMDTIDREAFAQIMQGAGAKAAEFLDGLLAMMRQEEAQMQENTKEHVDRLAEDLHCSVAMRVELTQLLTYWRLTGVDAGAVTDEYYARGMLPCKNKRAGRRLLDELQNKWL